jgi:hypothetical protein
LTATSKIKRLLENVRSTSELLKPQNDLVLEKEVLCLQYSTSLEVDGEGVIDPRWKYHVANRWSCFAALTSLGHDIIQDF